MIIYKVLKDLGDSIANSLYSSVGEVCLMKQGTWTREHYTDENSVIWFIKRR